jgi:hypothetical protein
MWFPNFIFCLLSFHFIHRRYLCYGKRQKWYIRSFFRPKLTSHHVILHVSGYLCDTCPHSHIRADVATIYIYIYIYISSHFGPHGGSWPLPRPVLGVAEPPPRAKTFFFFSLWPMGWSSHPHIGWSRGSRTTLVALKGVSATPRGKSRKEKRKEKGFGL